MILVIRSDGISLNLSAAVTFMELPEGLLVETAVQGDGGGTVMFILKGWTTKTMKENADKAGDRQNVIIMYEEWEAWPQ